MVPRERLLEVEVKEGWEKEGWMEIGRFLGVEEGLEKKREKGQRQVGKSGRNGREEFLREHEIAWWGMVGRSVINVGIVAVGASGVVGILMFCWMKVGRGWGR